MAVSELNHYNIRASTELLVELRDFYCSALGLTVGYRPPFNSVGYWLYAGSRPLLHLSTAADAEQRKPHVANTFDHVAFSCSEFDKMKTRLDTLGISYSVNIVPRIGQKQIFFEDPAGNGIELNFDDEASDMRLA
ncbi:VOC family protein [Undibacterium terreum]|uniref:Diguanylate cyclase n=1 Tax=Undibacterium terreum TaxID=1224302 RepID=A0A916UJJ1_9BURK|nr:VOC family protein [Undibacterium terreum]GGC75886.1 diguanylate cyclase [Undibacterium terreum]